MNAQASSPPDPDAMADAVLLASGALVRASTRALSVANPEVNLTEFRVLTILYQDGPQRLMDIAAALDVTSTTATRLADSLVEYGLVERQRQSNDRREVHLAIASSGRRLVRSVSTRRRQFVISALRGVPLAQQLVAINVLEQIAGFPRPADVASA